MKLFLIILMFFTISLYGQESFGDKELYHLHTNYLQDNPKIDISFIKRSDDLYLGFENMTPTREYKNLSSNYINVGLISSRNDDVDLGLFFGFGKFKSGDADINGSSFNVDSGYTLDLDLAFTQIYYFSYFSTNVRLSANYNKLYIPTTNDSLDSRTIAGKLGLGLNFLITKYILFDIGGNVVYGSYDIELNADDDNISNNQYETKTISYDIDYKLSFILNKSFNLSIFYNISNIEFGSKDEQPNTALDSNKFSAFYWNKRYIGFRFELITQIE